MNLVFMKQSNPSSEWMGLSGDAVVINKEEFAKFVKDVHDTMEEMLPGVRKIALQRYDRLNAVMVELERLNHLLK